MVEIVHSSVVVKQFQDYQLVYKFNFDFEVLYDYHPTPKSEPLTKKNNKNDERSIRRTKTTIADLVRANKFDFFITFTFAEDRTDIQKCKTKMRNWLKSRKNLQYLIVPEFHKDKKSIHFHSLVTGNIGDLIYSGIEQSGRKIYNLGSYQKGFTTAVFIDNYEKVSSYIRKYITKDTPIIQNKARYWCSQKLKRPETWVDHPDYASMTDSTLEYESKNWKIYKNDIKSNSNNNNKGEPKLWQKQKTSIKSSRLAVSSSSKNQKRSQESGIGQSSLPLQVEKLEKWHF